MRKTCEIILEIQKRLCYTTIMTAYVLIAYSTIELKSVQIKEEIKK